MTRLAVLVFVALAIAGVTGCGDDTQSARPSAAADQVYDFSTAKNVSLASLTAGRPTLVWFWAPWCEICNAEAPKIKALAGSKRLRVVGVGGRDSVTQGESFVRRHGLQEATMVYDEPEKVWDRFGVGPQPTGVLLDATGKEIRRWQGPFEPAEVEAAAREGAA